MTRDKHKKPAKKPKSSVSADTPAGRMRRLADAITTILANPITVRMSPLWSSVESDEDRLHLSPADAQKYAAEEETLRRSHGHRKELKAAFAGARLDLQEDEAVFLERAISCLPDTWVDAWTHADNMSDETFSKLRDLERHLMYRVAKSEALHPADNEASPIPGVCAIDKDPSGDGSVVRIGKDSYHITRPRCIEFIERAKSGQPVKWPRVRTLFQNDHRIVQKTWKDGREPRLEQREMRDHELFADRHIESAGRGRFCVVVTRRKR